MQDNRPAADTPSRRTLAAIMFTDIVDFSALMQGDEDHTLHLVKRDVDLLTEICHKYQGRKLKSTGDGMLLYFDSAVQAVACALEGQRTLAEAAKKLPPADVLKHRIGIHLGDVFVTDTDVMGDGVNIAARLQSEAEPGGICISQTVYDVVKNRLAVKATYLGARELKNIQEAIPVYQILLEAQTGGGRSAAAPKKKHAGLGAWQWVMVGTLLAVVSLAVVLAIVVLHGTSGQTQVAQGSGQARTGQAPASPTTVGAAESGTAAKSAAPSRPPIFADEKTAAILAAQDPLQVKINDERRHRLQRYDYSGMLGWLETNAASESELRSQYAKLVSARKVLMTKVTMASQSEPIIVTDRDGKRLAIWGSAVELTIKAPDGTRQVPMAQVQPGLMVRLLEAVGQSEASSILAEELRKAGMLME